MDLRLYRFTSSFFLLYMNIEKWFDEKIEDDVIDITQKILPATLERIGFKSLEVEIYLLLIKNNSQTAINIAERLKTNRRRVYRSLITLQNKAVVEASATRPAKFSAVSFDKVLDEFVSTNKEEANRIEQHKNELLTKWRTLVDQR